MHGAYPSMEPAGALSKPHFKGLTKPEARRLREVEASLQPYQDQKIDAYSKQCDEMSAVFEKARDVRRKLQAEYEARTRRVRAELSEMVAKTDAESRRHHDRLKRFSKDFEAGVEEAKTGWRQTARSGVKQVNQRGAALGIEADRLDEVLQKERDDCRAHTESETGPILEKLRQHREFLDKQSADREQSHVEFRANLEDHFGQLTERMEIESETRERECSDSRAELEKQFGELNEVQNKKDAAARQSLAELKTSLDMEGTERAESQATIVKSASDFMEQFEKSIAENQAKVKENSVVMRE